MRTDGRELDALRNVNMQTGYQLYPEGSCLIEMGNTRVLCSATIDDRVPHFIKGTGQGWITAQYGMLPTATSKRTPREAVSGRQSGRSQEIQRLIGRSMRSVMDLTAFPDRTVNVDCDVLQADGGTRTASITGAFVAVALAFHILISKKLIPRYPVRQLVAAISVGLVNGEPTLDLKYDEDSIADVDMNVVMTNDGKFVEIQGSAEHALFSRLQMDTMVTMAAKGIDQLFEAQRKALPFEIGQYGL